MKHLFKQNRLVLAECAVVERLRRSAEVEFHPLLVHAPLIYDDAGRAALTTVYQDYTDVAAEVNLPLLLCTPTWRASRSRVAEAGVRESINADAVHFLQNFRESQPVGGGIKIGGMIGCRNDCYLPEEALSAKEAEQFHAWQINQLASALPDFLIAQTLPNLQEAKGIARAMAATGLPYIISFVISRDGCLLDGTDLFIAVKTVDSASDQPPLGYMINCSYPTFLCAEQQPLELFERLIGYQANASSLDHCELDGAGQVEAESVPVWGDAMLELYHKFGLKILGGCCGTDAAHLRYLAGLA